MTKRTRKPKKKQAEGVKRNIIDYNLMPLSSREQKAADYYAEIPDVYDACVSAGYTPNTAKVKGWDIIQRPHVQYYLAQRARIRGEKHDITIDDQIRRIDKVIVAFEELLLLTSRPRLGKKQKEKIKMLMKITQGHTLLEAIKLQSHYMGFQPKLSKEAAIGPSFGSEDESL